MGGGGTTIGDGRVVVVVGGVGRIGGVTVAPGVGVGVTAGVGVGLGVGDGVGVGVGGDSKGGFAAPIRGDDLFPPAFGGAERAGAL